MISYQLLYRLGLAPWDRRPILPAWQQIVEGPGTLRPGRALDVGCGTGRDAVYLARRGWQVTAVDIVDAAITKARQRAKDEGVEVQWIVGSELGRLGLDPGVHATVRLRLHPGLPDLARKRAVAGMTELAAPGATLVLTAFARGRRMLLPRGMDKEEIIGLAGDARALVGAQPVTDPSAPPPVRRAHPTQYRLTRQDVGARNRS